MAVAVQVVVVAVVVIVAVAGDILAQIAIESVTNVIRLYEPQNVKEVVFLLMHKLLEPPNLLAVYTLKVVIHLLEEVL